MLINRLLTSAFVLVNGIVFSRSNGSMFNSMFDELKEECTSDFRNRFNRFQDSYNVKYFKEIKCLKSLQKAEANLEPNQVSMMELFCEYT